MATTYDLINKRYIPVEARVRATRIVTIQSGDRINREWFVTVASYFVELTVSCIGRSRNHR